MRPLQLNRDNLRHYLNNYKVYLRYIQDYINKGGTFPFALNISYIPNSQPARWLIDHQRQIQEACLYIIRNPLSDIDLDVAMQALLDQAILDSYVPVSGATLTYQNDLIKGLKEDGFWNRADTIWVPASNNVGDSDYACYNWKNPTANKINKVNAPAYGPGGFTGNAIDSYLNLMYNPTVDGVNYTQDNAGVLIYTPNWGSATASYDTCLGGRTNSTSSGPAVQLFRNNTDTKLRLNGSSAIQTVVNLENGLLSFNRDSSSELSSVFNGNVTTNGGLNSEGIPNVNMYALAYNRADIEVIAFSDTTLSAISFSDSVTDLASEISSRFQTYMTSIGQAV